MFNVFFYTSTVSGAQYGCLVQFLDAVLSPAYYYYCYCYVYCYYYNYY